MDRQKERDMNLIIVATVEEYGLRHQIPVKDVLSFFKKYNMLSLLRTQYEVLHMKENRLMSVMLCLLYHKYMKLFKMRNPFL